MTSKEKFIEEIATYVLGWKAAFKFGVPSVIIAQACKESAFGTSNKAMRHNYFGLKFRLNRVQCNSGVFKDSSYEWVNGQYVEIVTTWYSFPDMNFGVEGYFQFIDSGNYPKAKMATTPEDYVQALCDEGYATSPTYAESILHDYIDKYKLRRFDGGTTMQPDSSLVPLIINSPTTYGLRPTKADRITIHHMGCYPSPTAEEQCKRFANKSRGASANYCIGTAGDMCQGLLEAYAPCTSSNKANDLRAITFEVANNSGAPYWTVSPEALNSLVIILVDVCKRNSIPQLIWSDNKYDRINGVNGCNMTMHCDFWATTCPGPYLKKWMKDLAAIVNASLISPTPMSGYMLNGYDYGPVFNPEYYKSRYSDIANSPYGVSDAKLWEHFQMFGMNEHRQASDEFNPEIYRVMYGDLDKAFGDDWPMYYFHYVACGKQEIAEGKREPF